MTATTHGGGLGKPDRLAPLPSWCAYVAIMTAGAVLVLVAASTSPKPFGLGLIVLVVLLVAWFFQPVLALYATVALSLIGDIAAAPWWPFTKGFSSHESIMFIHNSLVFSPLELTLGVAVLALAVRYLVIGTWPLRLGPVGPALLAFLLFVTIAFLRGAVGGVTRQVAIFQVRPFMAMAAGYFLVTGLCRTAQQQRRLIWSVLLAIGVHSLLALQHLGTVSAAELELTESLVDHGAAVRMNVLFLILIAGWTLRGVPMGLRWTVTVMSIPAFWVYFVAQRRAAIIALLASLILYSVMLFWRQRKTFMKVVPAAGTLALGYVAAFWNSEASAGFPAQAVKSVIASDQVSTRNASSDLYRIIENYDLHFTIQQYKVFGMGLGRPFLRPVPLPDISGFGLNAFIPHNSLLWIWMTTGFFGLMALFYLAARCIHIGASKLRVAPTSMDLLIVLASTSYIAMFFVFSFVDIAWDAGNLMLLGVSIAVCTNYPVVIKLAPRRRLRRPLDERTRALIP